MARLAACIATAFVASASAQTMKELMDENNMLKTLSDLQAIAMRAASDYAPNGNRERSFGTHNDTVNYLVEAIANVSATLQPVRQTYMEIVWNPGAMMLERTGDLPMTFTPGTNNDFIVMGGCAGTTADGKVVRVGNADSSTWLGCDSQDFVNFTTGDIALILRGACGFSDKVLNAQAAGAAGVIVYVLEGQEPRSIRIDSAPYENIQVPAFMTTWETGQSLMSEDSVVTARMVSTAEVWNLGVTNLCVDLPGGDDDSVVIQGAHMDSVVVGPGINDNGSGTALLLELLRAFGERFGFDGNAELRNQFRLCWWASEEYGLLGSRYYVEHLSEEENLRITGYLNSDMAGSPNGMNAIMNGTADDRTPEANTYLLQRYAAAFESIGQNWTTYQPAGTDYQNFFAGNIPSGDIWSGAGGAKSANQALWFGGVAGQPHDPCYHKACDTIENIDPARQLIFGQVVATVAEEVLLDPDLKEHLDRNPGGGPPRNRNLINFIVLGVIILVAVSVMIFGLRSEKRRAPTGLIEETEVTEPAAP